MKLSLITVCYNSALTLPSALESVLRQRGAEYEYLVVDGGSADGTVGLLETWEPRFDGRMRWTSERDRGLYDAINKGIARASGDLVALLHADDILDDDGVLATWCRAFEEEPMLDAVYGDIRFIPNGAANRDAPTSRYYSGAFWKPWMLRWGLMPPHPSFAIRREHFARLGGYLPDTFRIAADHELLVRYLYKAHLRTRYLPLCTTAMRLGGLSTDGVRARLRLNREIVRANRMNGLWCCLPMMAPKYAYKAFEVVLPRLRGMRP